MTSSAKSVADSQGSTGVAARDNALEEGSPLLEAGPAAVDALAPAGLSPASARRRRIFERPRWTVLCVGLDVVLMLLGNVAAIVGAPAAHAEVRDAELIWLFPVLVVGFLALRGGYRDRIDVRVIDGLARIVAATSLAAISLIAAAALLDPDANPAPLISRAWLFATVYVASGHALLAWARKRARASRLIADPTLIVGAGHVGARVEHRLTAQPELGLIPIGYLDSDPPPADMVPARRVPVLGTPDDISRIAAITGARHVVFGFSSAPDHSLIPLVRECESIGLTVSLVPRMFESVNVHVALDRLGGLPLLGLRWISPRGNWFALKHAVDRVVAAIALAALAPLLLAITAAVKLGSPGPVLFRQRRIGRDGREFEMLKFRSMRPGGTARAMDTLQPGMAPGGVEGEDRRTWIGGYLRRTSLDELPQLINVLRGDMSLVGPRPERPEFVRAFEREVGGYADRLRVKSGLTGWAQVHGLRGQTSLADRVEWDNWYIQNWSFGLDLKIMLMTIVAFLKRAE
jgi:exopolysaccharide biosynthesis polyprenyl glycosylphosphotransferase